MKENIIKTKSKRLIVSILTTFFFMAVTLISAYRATELIGTAAIGGIITIVTVYILGETKRPSASEPEKK